VAAKKNHENLGRLMLLMAQGLRKHLPAGTHTLRFAGETQKVDDLVGQLEGYAAWWTAADAAQEAAHKAVHERDDVAPPAKALHDGLKRALKSLFGPRSDELKNFGVEPEKERQKLSGEERAAANAKARATRAKNHPKSP